MLRRRCFAVGGGEDNQRLVMPAMGAYTGGLNVLDAAYAPLFDTVSAWVMGAEGVYLIERVMLAPDPGSVANRLESVRNSKEVEPPSTASRPLPP